MVPRSTAIQGRTVSFHWPCGRRIRIKIEGGFDFWTTVSEKGKKKEKKVWNEAGAKKSVHLAPIPIRCSGNNKSVQVKTKRRMNNKERRETRRRLCDYSNPFSRLFSGLFFSFLIFSARPFSFISTSTIHCGGQMRNEKKRETSSKRETRHVVVLCFFLIKKGRGILDGFYGFRFDRLRSLRAVFGRPREFFSSSKRTDPSSPSPIPHSIPSGFICFFLWQRRFNWPHHSFSNAARWRDLQGSCRDCRWSWLKVNDI